MVAAGCGSIPSTQPDATTGEVDATQIDAMPTEEVDAQPATAAPVNATSSGAVDEGGTLSLAGKLVTADADSTPDELTYTIRSLPAHGTLKKNNQPVGIGDTFTQQEVATDVITYVNNGAEVVADEFAWDLSDGMNTIPASGTIAFAITINPVNDAPTIVNNPNSTIAEGGTEVLSNARLMAADAENEQLTYTLLGTTHGQVQLNNVAVPVNGTFTQQDIADGKVKFVDSGVDDAALQVQNNTTASFSWKVTDAHGGVNPATGSNVSTFTITSVDDLPTVAWKLARCAAAGSSINVTAVPFTSLTDPDNTIAQYQVCITGIGLGHTYVDTGTQTFEDTSVAMNVKNNGTVVGTGSCFPANALSGLTVNGAGNVSRGSVSWKLVKNGVQVGSGVTVGFPVNPPPAGFPVPSC